MPLGEAIALPRLCTCVNAPVVVFTLKVIMAKLVLCAVMKRISTPMTGLFPAPSEISFDCSCPDWAGMCKHIAAVMYGVGKRLDRQPELLFGLRGVDAKDLVTQAGAGLSGLAKGKKPAKVLDDAALADVFGLEMDEGAAAPPAGARKAKVKKEGVTKLAPKKGAAKGAAAKPSAAKKLVARKPAVSKPAVRGAAAKKAPAKQPLRKPVKLPVKAPAKGTGVAKRLAPAKSSIKPGLRES